MLTREQIDEHIRTMDEHMRRDTPTAVYASWIALRGELRTPPRRPSTRLAAVVDGVGSFVRAGHILDDARAALDEGLAQITSAGESHDASKCMGAGEESERLCAACVRADAHGEPRPPAPHPR